MADPIKKSPEIVTENDIKPVLENKSFDAEKFLRLYNQWKGSNNQDLFFELRGMCTVAGYTNKQVLTKVDQEMNEIAAIIQKYQISKQTVATQTASATSATSATVVVRSKEELKSSVDEALQAINMKDINKMKQGLDKLRLALNVPGLAPSDKDAILGYTGKMLVTRIEQSGYRVYLQDKKVIVEPIIATGDRAISTALASMLNQDSINLQSIATGLLYSSSQFANFVAINTSETDGKKSIQKTNADYFEYLRDATRSSKRTPSDEALSRSESAVRNTLALTPEKMQSLMTGHMNTGEWMKNNPAIIQAITSQNHSSQPTTSPSPTNPQNQPNPKPASNSPATPVNNKVAEYLGKAGLTLEGGIGDIFNTPGALPALLVAFIATWIFGDFKKALIVLAGGFGISSVAHAVQNRDGQSAGAPAPTGTPNGTPSVINVPSPKVIDKNKIKDPSKLKAVAKIEQNPQIAEMIAQQRKEAYTDKSPEVADLADYIDFIHSDSFQQRKANDIVNPTEFKSSMFSDKATFDKAGQNSLNNNILKRVLRIYFTGSQDIVAPVKGSNLQRGEKEKNDFITAHTTFFNDKNKTVSDLTTEVYK